MRRLTCLLTLMFLFQGYVLDGAAAHAGSISNGHQEAQRYEIDDRAFCTDGPGPDAIADNPSFGGKPVSLLTGAETLGRNDLSIGSIFPISVIRRYDSRASFDSPVGFGWSLNYDRRLYTYPDNSVTLRTNCGWKRTFSCPSGPGTCSNPIGETGALVKNGDGSFTYWSKFGWRDEYDLSGKLSAMYDPAGNALQFLYAEASGVPFRAPLKGVLPTNVNQNNTDNIVSYNYQLVKIEEINAGGQPTGAAVNFTYDSNNGRLLTIWDSANRTVTFAHDTAGYGNLTEVNGPAGSALYKYEDASYKHALTSLDEGRGTYVNQYEAGKVKTQSHAGGTISFDYVVPYKKTIMTTTITGGTNGPLTQTRTVEFDDLGQPSKVTDTFGNITTYVRDSNAWILVEGRYDSSTGITTTTAYTYDLKGNVLTRTEAQGTAIEKTTTYTYHPAFNSILTETAQSVVNPTLFSTVTNSYHPATGNLLTREESGYLGDGTPYTYTTTYTYDANGRLATIDGPRTDVSDVTEYNYDSLSGNLLTLTRPLIGAATFSNYDNLGNPRTVTDPNGNSTTYTYDTNGRIATVKAHGDTNSTQYFYVSGNCSSSCNGIGKIDHIILPEGNTITFHYDDGVGNLTSISDSLGNTINYTYDSARNKLTEVIRDSGSSLQKSLGYEYDKLNRLSKIKNSDTNYTEYQYYATGNKQTTKDPNNNSTAYFYDELNRLKIVTQPGPIDTLYGYNSNNNLTSVKDANNNTTTYIYDDKGRVYQAISPDTGTTTYAYDPAGNLISKTDAKNVTINYAYDPLNRLTAIDYPNDVDTIYAYDTCLNGKGRLCSMADASGTTTYEYSPKGQVTKETKLIDSRTYITQYTYDQNGNMKTMTYPSGKVITYNYTNDRAVSVLNGAANLATSIAYKPFGGMSSLVYGNGLTNTITYDTQYRLATLTTGTIQNTYGYDFNGNITSITPGKAYSYDALDRLGTATGPWGSLGWTYDGVGNRQTENANTYTYTPNTNKLSSANGNSFGYDNNGNTTAEGARQFVYNQNQRLIQVVDAGVTKGEYTYNGNGQRVKKVAGGVTTIFHYSQNGQIIAESNSAGTITAEYVYLNSQPLAKMEGANTDYYHNDHLGTPQKMTDSTGTVVWAADYKPFGEATITVSTITNNVRGIGQYADAETGLLYNYTRNLNTTIGRYNEADRIGLRGGINLYAFVGNNPVFWIDPRGLRITYCDDKSKDEFTKLIDLIKETDTGWYLIWKLENDPSIFVLHANAGPEGPAYRSGNDIYIDPSFHPMMYTTDGPQAASTTRILAHELGHLTGSKDDGTGRMNNINNWENPIMYKLEGYSRTRYQGYRP